MDLDLALGTARDLLASWAKERAQPEPGRLDVAVAVEDLLSAVQAITEADWGYLSAITGLDHGESAGQIEVLYHFCTGAAVLSLRVLVPRTAASLPSVCGLIPSAVLFERELSEMLGMTVVGIPDPSRLFLPEDWPEGVPPLRKEFVPEEPQPT